MSEENKDLPQDSKKGFLKTVLLFFVSVLLLLAVVAGVLQIPSVQTLVVQKLSTYFSEKTGFPVKVARVHLRWFDSFELDELQVYDQQDSLMISIEEAFVDFHLLNLIKGVHPTLDEVVLNKPRVQLLKNAPENGLNINAFIRNIQDLLPPAKPGPKKYTAFTIQDVTVHDGTLIYNDQHQDSLQGIFDYNHIYLHKIDGQLEAFRIIADTVEFNLKELSTTAPFYDFKVDQLKTFYRFTEQSMLFRNLDLKAGDSYVSDSLVFTYSNIEALEYFVDSVSIHANLKNSIINSMDLAVFAPYFQDYQETYYLSGQFDGTVSKFQARDIDIHFGKTKIRGDLSMDGLPNFDETFIEADLHNSEFYPPDLERHFDQELFAALQKLGFIRFDSQFLGFPNDFVANGKFETKLGKIQSDINLKLNSENTELSTYSGSLALQNFAIGRMLGEPDLQRISMKGTVNGKGFTLNEANLQLNATISQLGYRNYNYRNIKTKGALAKRFFEGDLSVNDPNLKMKGKGSIDLRNNLQELKVAATLDTAFFKALKLMDEELFVRANINLNLKGLDIDDIQGEVNLSNAYLEYQNRELALDTLSLFTALDSTGRQLMIETSLADLYAAGNFNYSTLAEDLQRLYHEYRLNFRNNSEEIEDYYNRKGSKTNYNRYNLQFLAKLKNANPLIHLFEPQVFISKNTEIEGSFTGGYTSILSANTTVDTLQYKNDFLYNLEAELNTSKIADSTNVLAMAFLQSSEQFFSGVTPTEKLVLEAIWDRDHIELSGDIKQVNSSNLADLNADVFFLEDQTLLSFRSSVLSILENNWHISKNNRIIFENGKILFEDFQIKDKDQSIIAEGVISDNIDEKLNIQINNFQLSNLNPILEQQLSGAVNGSADLQHLLSTPMLNGKVQVKDFMVEKFLVGDLNFEASWNKNDEHLDLSLSGIRKGIEIVSAEGYYNPFVEDNSLNINAIFYKTNLDIIEPFIEGIFSKIKGTASGRVQITGSPRYPILRGGGSVNGGQIRIDYTNTLYTFEGGFILSENEIGFRDLNLLDSDNNTAYLNGGIFHDGFDNFIIDLKAKLNGTKVLNTTFQDNELFYGTAYANGDLEILGPINNLLFIANASTAKGTKMFIPIDFGTDVEQREYINFISRKDTTGSDGKALEVSMNQKAKLSGIKLDFDLDITPDAYCEIIFDLKAGDIIRGRGTGKLDLQIDTNGEFTMFGNYEITKGAYNFTLFNVITKEFVIDPGSSIRWMGDPYGGIMDIKARYKQSASLLPILQRGRDTEPTPQERRPYPVTLIMDLHGDLMSPDIEFDIELKDYPGVFYSEVQRFKSQLKADEQYLNRQVFNLIVLRQFAHDNTSGAMAQSALGFGSQTAISSISELLSNQFSALVTQIDENLEIDVDVSSSIDADAINTFQLRLSYTFLDGRLRVTRDGSIASRYQQQDVNNLIGDWTIEYMLTQDGQYRVKMYSRNNLNQINGQFNLGDNYTQGVSLSQTKSFDSLKELFEKKKKSRPSNQPLPIQDNNDEVLLREEDLLSTPVIEQ